MRLQMHAVHFAADQKLLEHIQRKLDKLDTFYDRIVSGEVFLRLDGADTNKVKDKIVEVRLNVPGKQFFVEASDKSFESATDHVLDILKDKLVRFKQKRNDQTSPDIVREKERMQAEEPVEVVEDEI